MVKAMTMVLLLAAAVNADIMETRNGTIVGIATMRDSVTVSVTLPLGGMRILPAKDVRAVFFNDSNRYGVFEVPLRKLGIHVDQGPSGGTTSAPVRDALPTPAPVSDEHKVPSPGPQDQSILLATFQSQRRDPAMAGLLSAFVPTLGHVYAGEGGNGAEFLVGEVALVAAAVLCSRAAAATDSSDDGVILTVVSTVCWAGAAVTKICECGDAVNAANRYNERLRERLGLQIGLLPQRSEAALGVACRF